MFPQEADLYSWWDSKSEIFQHDFWLISLYLTSNVQLPPFFLFKYRTHRRRGSKIIVHLDNCITKIYRHCQMEKIRFFFNSNNWPLRFLLNLCWHRNIKRTEKYRHNMRNILKTSLLKMEFVTQNCPFYRNVKT